MVSERLYRPRWLKSPGEDVAGGQVGVVLRLALGEDGLQPAALEPELDHLRLAMVSGVIHAPLRIFCMDNHY